MGFTRKAYSILESRTICIGIARSSLVLLLWFPGFIDIEMEFLDCRKQKIADKKVFIDLQPCWSIVTCPILDYDDVNDIINFPVNLILRANLLGARNVLSSRNRLLNWDYTAIQQYAYGHSRQPTPIVTMIVHACLQSTQHIALLFRELWYLRATKAHDGYVITRHCWHWFRRFAITRELLEYKITMFLAEWRVLCRGHVYVNQHVHHFLHSSIISRKTYSKYSWLTFQCRNILLSPPAHTVRGRSAIIYRYEDGWCLLVSAMRYVTISNPDLRTSSETEVIPGMRKLEKYT